MELKRYQERVLETTRSFLQRLAEEQGKGNKYASDEAWQAATGLEMGYRRSRNGLGKDFPCFCIKVPTGGGKTLLATQILGQICSTILRARNGSGLALWIVPSDQIYKDTLKALRDRRHPYRESLEFAVGRRVEIWEKDEILRLTRSQLSEALNILVFKLASANRETKDQLRMFQDAGGNIVQHFPPEDDPAGHRALRERFPNLDSLTDDLLKTSLGNLARICEPPVILDEGHKAYSELARNTLEGFNASIIVELSATPPKESNILCKVGGAELLDEEMIKLPINVATSAEISWKTCLAKAKDKRDELERLAGKRHAKTGLAIRPIVLVQVERTGKDQREAPYVHSLDAKEHLIERLGVPDSEIAVKTSDTDDIEGIDLLDEGCRIRWIITKQALQEGWDCPFAYVLVSLNNTKSELSMTQLVGRVLRQPYARKTGVQELDESYVYCLRKKAGQIMREIKSALEDEGYEGDETSVVDRTGDTEEEPRRRAMFRPEFKRLYRPFEGAIYLPRFCVKDGPGYEGFDWFRHLLHEVDVDRFRYDTIDWNLADEMERAKEVFYRITLGQQDLQAAGQRDLQSWEGDDGAKAWLVANLGFDHFSHKELRRIVESAVGRLRAVKDRLALVKFIVRDKLAAFISEETESLTEAAFQRLHRSGRLCFYLKCVRCRFEIPPEVTLRSTKRLVHEDNTPVRKSLFDAVSDSSFNEYEKEVALVLDRHPEVLWWYRNEVGRETFAIQGYRKDRIYPDFVVQKGRPKAPEPAVLVVEAKGGHLAGNPDTAYKREIAGYFEGLGKSISWQQLGKGFEDSTFRFQILDQTEHNGWKEKLLELLGER